MKDKQLVNEQRRKTLKTLGGVAVVGAIAGGTTLKAVANEQEQETKVAHQTSTHYHETQHIRDYYDSL